MRRYLFLFLLSPLFLMNSSCQASKKNTRPQPSKVDNSYGLQSVLWQQNAAEHKALCYQAYQLAGLRLKQFLTKEGNSSKNLAIITDIDETVLDNSPYQAKLIRDGTSYSKKSWLKWGKKVAAKPIPGALAFFKKAKKAGVSIFYLSNRSQQQQKETLDNLKKFGFPDADSEHILLKTAGQNKEIRRKKVLASHKVLMYLGDNLSDFSVVFDHQSTRRRNALTDSLQTAFGKRFIVLPNPTYGAWETDGIYEGKYNWTPLQKDSIARAKLKSY